MALRQQGPGAPDAPACAAGATTTTAAELGLPRIDDEWKAAMVEACERQAPAQRSAILPSAGLATAPSCFVSIANMECKLEAMRAEGRKFIAVADEVKGFSGTSPDEICSIELSRIERVYQQATALTDPIAKLQEFVAVERDCIREYRDWNLNRCGEGEAGCDSFMQRSRALTEQRLEPLVSQIGDLDGVLKTTRDSIDWFELFATDYALTC